MWLNILLGGADTEVSEQPLPVGSGRVQLWRRPSSGLSDRRVRSLLPDRPRAVVVAHAAPAGLEAVHPRVQLRLLRRREPAVLPAAGGDDPREPSRCPARAPARGRGPAAPP